MLEILIPFTVFFGVISGYFLSLIAPEELRDGKKYFEIFRSISLTLFIMILIIIITNNYILSAIATIAIFYLMSIFKYVGLIFIISGGAIFFIPQEFILTSSILLFFAGMGSSSLVAVDYEKNEKIAEKKKLFLKTMKLYLPFLIISILPFLFSYLS